MNLFHLPVLIGTALLSEVALAGQCDSKQPVCVGDGPVCNDQCSGGYSCTSMAKSYSCQQLATFSNCNNGRCDCTCPPGAPVPAPTQAKQGKCSGKTSSPCFAPLATWQKDAIIARHNEIRVKHGACPLAYDKAIADYSLNSRGFQNTCNYKSLTHNSPPEYAGGRLGENLAYVGGKTDMHNWDVNEGTEMWYCGEEGCWDYGGSRSNGVTGHMTQLVWKKTTKFGCGLCHVTSGRLLNVYLICNYEVAGNWGKMGPGHDYEENIGRYGETPTGCANSPPANNECDATPCPSGQTCADPDTAKDNDFTCTCDSYPSIVATGGSARCEKDECGNSPCGSDQTCNDPNKAANSLHDFVCTCKSDTSIRKTDGAATCTKNECDKNPCDGGQSQTCDDPVKTVGSTGDYTCTCPNGVVATGGPVNNCVTNECDANPCGSSEQDCNDPDTASNVLHDFVCSCKSKPTTKQTDGPAKCSKNECDSNPCDAAQSQTCNDPSQTASSIGDYVCTCPNGVKATGGPVSKCMVNECDSQPCGGDQDCNDPNTGSNKLRDFVCTCKSDASITKVNGPATCTKNECDGTPCGGQMCSDANTSPTSLNDFVCACTNGVKATGSKATCEVDECSTFDCGMGQSCTDGKKSANSLNDFECSCDNDMTLKATGKAVSKCTNDECAGSPCGSQTCSDPNMSAGSTGDFICTCPAPNQSVTQVGKPATCSMGNEDECSTTPCGAGQTCSDPDTTAASKNDYVCQCSTGTGSKVGGMAACKLDECDASPCGSGQTCADANDDASSTGDYMCKCGSPQTGEKMGGAATCALDECLSTPCASGQTCDDPVKTPGSLLDFVCTCANKAKATGASAVCEVDECAAADACGTAGDQDCNDPNKSSGSQHDFECTCKADATIKQVDGAATCTANECDSNPCDASQSQVCNDPSPTFSSVKDYTCTCPNGVKATGGSVPKCIVDECAADPCGSDQTCKDPDTTANMLHDFTCTCKSDTSITKKDGAATCSKNECDSDPCDSSQNQKCNDPMQTRDSIGDFTCTCPNGVKSTGAAVLKCEENECDANPCGMGQLCMDPNYIVFHDFVCQCKSDAAIEQTDGPARCSKNECEDKPCGDDQECMDPDQSLSMLHDYVCTCPNNGPTATGTKASCGVDECLSNPCSEGQVCVDRDRSATGNFDCRCPFGLAHNIGGPVEECDECNLGSSKNPCAWEGHPNVVETCKDPTKKANMVDDFVCTCPNGVFKVGGPADCDKTGECSSDPCGAHQICSDPDVMKDGDFVCTCEADHTENVGGPVTDCAFDECKPPRGVPPCPEDTQTCTDPNTSPGSMYDFVCKCKNVNGMVLEGEKIGGEAECKTVCHLFFHNNYVACLSC